MDLYCEWNIHHEEEARPNFCCSLLFSCSLRTPVSIHEGRGANNSYPLLRVHDRRTPAPHSLRTKTMNGGKGIFKQKYEIFNAALLNFWGQIEVQLIPNLGRSSVLRWHFDTGIYNHLICHFRDGEDVKNKLEVTVKNTLRFSGVLTGNAESDISSSGKEHHRHLCTCIPSRIRIRDILIRIQMRIRILGFVPLPNGGCGSVPRSSAVTFRMQKKSIFSYFLCLYKGTLKAF